MKQHTPSCGVSSGEAMGDNVTNLERLNYRKPIIHFIFFSFEGNTPAKWCLGGPGTPLANFQSIELVAECKVLRLQCCSDSEVPGIPPDY